MAARHVLFVEAGLGQGGATKCLLSLVETCAAQGWKVSAAVTYPVPELEQVAPSCMQIPLYSDRLYRWGQRIRGTGSRQSGSRGRAASVASFLGAAAIGDLPAAARLAGYARRNQVDLIHANNELLANRVGILAGRLARLPVVSHQRGWPCRSRATGMLAGAVDRIVAVSDAVTAALIDVGISPDKIRRIYDGVDVGRFAGATGCREAARRALGFAPDDEVVGLPAALLPWKGHGMFLKAFAGLAGRRPRAKALLVGAGPANAGDLRPALNQQITELGLGDRVLMVGHVHDMGEVYAAMDLVAHTSIEPEPFGLVVVEAMAAGKAVVAADAGGPAEIIESGTNGCLYPIGDADALAQAMTGLLEGQALRDRLAHAAPDRARRFDPWQTRSETLAMYADLLDVAPGRQRRTHTPGLAVGAP